jgi:hypothetical protein
MNVEKISADCWWSFNNVDVYVVSLNNYRQITDRQLSADEPSTFMNVPCDYSESLKNLRRSTCI